MNQRAGSAADRPFHVPARVFGQDAGTPGQGAEPLAVHQPGGALLQQVLHPSITVFDQMFRTLPDDGWYNPGVSPQRPVQFELGSYKVPAGLHLWLMGYQFSVFRQSGTDAGDYMPAEDARFSNVLGWDLTLDGKRPASLLFQLDPIPVQATRQQFEPQLNPLSARADIFQESRAVRAQFNRAAANSFASTANPGTSLLPNRERRVGPAPPAPFTYVCREGVSVALGCVIFRPVPSPLAFVQGELFGYLVQTNMSDSLQNRLRPR